MRNAGFTLVEVLVVLGIFGCVAAFGLFVYAGSYQSQVSRTEYERVAVLLERARSKAMLADSAWGFCFDLAGESYYLFRGGGYDPALVRESLPASGGVSISASPVEVACAPQAGVVFSALSATTTPTTLVITQHGKTHAMYVYAAGSISW